MFKDSNFESHMSKNFAQWIWTNLACSLTYEQILITIANNHPIHSKQKRWLNYICIVEFPSICNQLQMNYAIFELL